MPSSARVSSFVSAFGSTAARHVVPRLGHVRNNPLLNLVVLIIPLPGPSLMMIRINGKAGKRCPRRRGSAMSLLPLGFSGRLVRILPGGRWPVMNKLEADTTSMPIHCRLPTITPSSQRRWRSTPLVLLGPTISQKPPSMVPPMVHFCPLEPFISSPERCHRRSLWQR